MYSNPFVIVHNFKIKELVMVHNSQIKEIGIVHILEIQLEQETFQFLTDDQWAELYNAIMHKHSAAKYCVEGINPFFENVCLARTDRGDFNTVDNDVVNIYYKFWIFQRWEQHSVEWWYASC